MRSSLRSILLIAFIAGHASVMSVGPSLHGLLGLDHGSSWGSVAPGEGSQALGHAAHDCAACHLFSLAQHNPDAVVAYHSTPQAGRVSRPLRAQIPPREARAAAPSRAPPVAHFLSIA